MIRCIVVDDEAHAIELLTMHIQQIPFLKLIGTANHSMEALDMLHHEDIDLIFLDIQMPGMSGIEFLPFLQGKCKVILTTAFREYALDGYEFNVIDYLLKPIFFSRFLLAVQRAQEVINNTKAEHYEAEDYILVKTEYKGKFVKIKLTNIIFIESQNKYITIHTRDGETITTMLNIGNLDNKLSNDRFIRIHKSFVIAIPFITVIQGNLVHLEHTKSIIPIGQTYKETFMNLMLNKVVSNTKDVGL